MRYVTLPDGTPMPALGQGTWQMGERAAERGREVAALRLGLDLGLVLIDSAEMYGSGGAEEVVGEAIAGRRDEVFLVSKLYPHNASRAGTRQACEQSLARLGTDRLDLYLLHWRGGADLEAFFDAAQALVESGKILRFGVSNFDLGDMEDAIASAAGGALAANQVLYNLETRSADWALADWCRARSIPLMAYTPLGQGDLLDDPALIEVAAGHGATPAQIALAWLLARPGVTTIPKASSEAHVRENAAALEIELGADDLAALDAAFPPPEGPTSLSML